MMVRVEAGIVTADLQAQVEAAGLFYPPDPSSIKHSTIGAMSRAMPEDRVA